MSFPDRRDFLRRINFDSKAYDWVLLAVVATVTIFGLAFLASSLSAKGADAYQREFLHQLVFGVWIGGVLAFILARVDYHNLFKYRKVFLILTLLFLVFLAAFAVYAKLMGYSPGQAKIFINSFAKFPIHPQIDISGGAVRWIELGGGTLSFQPSELTKLTLLVYFASFLQQSKEQVATWLTLKRPLYVFGLCAGLIVIQPDLGTVLIMSCILLSALWIGKVPAKIIFTISTIVILVAVILTFTVGYRKSRLDATLSQDCSSATAYQVCQTKAAILNGGLLGKGYGNSEFKQNNLIPEVTSDAILGVIGEEMGFIVTSLFLSLYLVVLWRGLKIAHEAPDVGGKALATGISVWLVSQAFLNVAGIIGLIPLKGLPLPFVSEGGTSLVLNLASIGILLNISSQRESLGRKLPNVAKNISRIKKMRYGV